MTNLQKRVKWGKLTHTLLIALLALSAVVSLDACSLVGLDPGKYDKINASASALHLERGGKITHEYNYGGGTEGAPTYEAFVSGANAYQKVVAQIEHAGYRHLVDNYWALNTSGGEFAAVLQEIPAVGGTFVDPSGNTVSVPEGGALIVLY